MSHHNDDHGTGDAPAQGPVPGPFFGSSASEEEGVKPAPAAGEPDAALDTGGAHQPDAVPARPVPSRDALDETGG